MTANGRRTVASHDPHDQRPDHGDPDDEGPEVIVPGSYKVGGESPVKGKVGYEADETGKQLGCECSSKGNGDRESRNPEQAPVVTG